MGEIHLILLFMIAAALIAVAVKDLLSSVIAVGAAGIGLSLAFLILKAPDLAIMQLVVEILSLIILIRATIRQDLPFSASGRWLFNTVATLFFLAAFLVAARSALRHLPRFGEALMNVSKYYVEEGASKAGVENVVASIALSFRSYDTLGEVSVIFVAIIGVLAVARRIGRHKEVNHG